MCTQCCVHFCFTAERLSYTFVSAVFFIFFSTLASGRILILLPCAVQPDLVGFRPVWNSSHLPVPHARAPLPLPSLGSHTPVLCVRDSVSVS